MHCKILAMGHCAALTYAVEILKGQGIPFAENTSDSPTHLLLPVPSLTDNGYIKGGGLLTDILQTLPQDITVIGGMLQHPALKDRNVIDLLQDPDYIAENASITAHCAIAMAMKQLPCTLHRCPTLLIGWGRISKCLCKLLDGLGASITVAARKATDRAMVQALGYDAVDIEIAEPARYRLIYNTAPAMVFPQCPGNALKIDLASRLGIGGLDVIWARGLPGKDAPESSGALIAKTICKYLKTE